MGLLGNLLTVLTTKDDSSSILSERGDKMDARITDTGREVIRVNKNNGKTKYSATRYPSGTIVETKTTKK